MSKWTLLERKVSAVLKCFMQPIVEFLLVVIIEQQTTR